MFAEPLARTVDEDLVLDPGGLVLADVARLRREDDGRVALTREEHIGVAMDDDEAGHVGDRALEARGFRTADEHRVEVLLGHGLTDEPVAALDLLAAHHDRSKPFTSDQIARFSGVGTPRSSPKRERCSPSRWCRCSPAGCPRTP